MITDINTYALHTLNSTIVKTLKQISNFQWTGTTIHQNIDQCLTAINLDSTNSGHYKPIAKRIPGLNGIYMLNQNGSIYYEARVIKEDEKRYKIEYLTQQGYNEFQELFDLMFNQTHLITQGEKT